MKDQIRKKIQKAIAKLYPEVDIEFAVDYAPDSTGADFSSNVAMILGKILGKKPMEVGTEIAGEIRKTFAPSPRPNTGDPSPARGEGNTVDVYVSSPGFLNFKLDQKVWSEELGQILKEQDKYGHSKAGKGQKLNVEFVSANPTGPLTVGHGRGATIGSTLSRVLMSQGYDVVREYYFNDGGKQMQNLAESVRLRAAELAGEKIEFPENLYQGEYIKEIAAEYLETHNPLNPPYLKGEGRGGEGIGDDWRDMAKFATDIIFAGIKKTLQDLGVEFDVFSNELALFDKTKPGNIWEVLEQLRAKGIVTDKDGAVWLKHPSLNPSPSRGGKGEVVLVRSTGEPTYRLPDIAYHVQKLKLGYEKIINVLGADHIAQFPDIKFAVKTLGYDDSKIEIIINQFVALAGGGGASKKMSTRKATYVTLDELIAEAGPDVTKFFMLMSGSSSHMTFDLELAKDTSDRNPVYKVQYAHARINSILEKAKQQGHNPLNPPYLKGEGRGDWIPNQVWDDNIREMIKELGKFPELLAEIAETYAVHQLPHYLLGLAEKFHGFYERVRVITDDEQETAGRLALVRAVQTVIANGLRLMGIEPMEKM